MFNLKGLYEWELRNLSGKVEESGQQWNIISDRFLNFMCTSAGTDSYGAYYNGMAVQLSSSVTTPGVDYRVAGASNNFTILATGAINQYKVNWDLRSKYCDNNFSPPVSPRTIRIIGVKIFSLTSDIFPTPNFVSFIELTTPITQNTDQYLYVKYTVFVTFTPGLGYNTPNNRFLEFSVNNSMFSNIMIQFGHYSTSTYNTTKFYLTAFLPPTNIDYMARAVPSRYSSVPEDVLSDGGSTFARRFQKSFSVGSVTSSIGAIVFQINANMSVDGQFRYMNTLYGYSQVKDTTPSVSRVFVHPVGRDSQLYSDPAYPASSQGTVTITGTPTNKYTVVGRIRVTKTGDATDLIDETVNYTAIDSGADTITVTQDIATGDKYRFTTTGTLPSPLALLTDYYIIRVDATTIKIASSYANAIGGTAIDLTTQGTGDHTLSRQNTGRYRLELEPWFYQTRLIQLSMAIDYDGYVMPVELDSTYDTPNNYAEGDYIANSSSSTSNGLLVDYGSSMLRGSLKNGDYIYSVQQSRKGLINNICRWRFNTVETSQPLCKFGSGSTLVNSVFANVTNTKMYIATNEGLYEYTFASPSIAPTLLSITGLIDSDLKDACLDPITGYIWTGHTSGLSRIDLGALTATQYTTSGALSGMTASEVNVFGGHLDAYNGRVLKGGSSNVGVADSGDAWVLQDGVGYYRVNGTTNCMSCCLRKGTDQVVWMSSSTLLLRSVTVTGLNTGSATTVESWSASPTIDVVGANLAQFSDTTFLLVHTNSSGSGASYITAYKIGSGLSYYTLSTSTGTPYYYNMRYGCGFGWAMGALRRNQIDVDGNGSLIAYWHNYVILPGFPFPQYYGWDGATWVKDNTNSRDIPKTATHTLLNGLSVDFNNATGSPWDQQYVENECFNFVHGPYRIKDNLQELLVKARSYYCEAHVVEAYPSTIPGSGDFTIDIPERVDPNFRDLDTIDYITEVYEGVTRYTRNSPTGITYTVDASTDIITIAANIPTGTPVIVSSTGANPSPLVTQTLYYVINLSPTTIKLANSYANALIGTAIDITSTGSGTRSLFQILPTTGTYYSTLTGTFVFSSADAGKNVTLTYTYTKFTT